MEVRFVIFLFFKQKTAYEVRISDWSSDVCSSDLPARHIRLPEVPLDGLKEVGNRDRLGDIRFAAAFPDLLLVTLHGEGGHGDHRDRLEPVVLLDPLRHLEAGDLGKLNVHAAPVGAAVARPERRGEGNRWGRTG